MRTFHRHAQALLALWRVDERLARPLAVQVAAVFADATLFTDVTPGITQLERLLTAVDTHLEHSRLRSALNSAASVRDQFEGCGGPVVDDAKRFLRDALRTVPADRDEDPWLPRDWRAAWEWARARGYLDASGGRERLKRICDERLTAEADIRTAYSRLVEWLTWRALKANMTPAISAALAAYLTAVTRIGAGTGIRATRFRRDARHAMSKAHGATRFTMCLGRPALADISCASSSASRMARGIR